MSTMLKYPGEAGLLRMRRVYNKFVEVYKPSYKVIHVAGTSGKGSTTLIIAQILEALGLRVGVFINPYLYNELEYLQINGAPIGKRLNNKLKREVESFVCDLEIPEIGKITYFERLTTRAVLCFAKEAVDVAVIETAIGGLYDATNVVDSNVSVIGPISIDHARLLGTNRSEIAAHKAGIIKASNSKVVVGRQQEDAQEVIMRTAKKLSVRTSLLGKDFEVVDVKINETSTLFSYRGYLEEEGLQISNIALSLIGNHQADNAGVAITAARTLLGSDYDMLKFSKGVKKALKKVKNPGRFEIRRHKKNDRNIRRGT
ncbi:MAG: Folylpolyglutamate synthase [Microgenomates bacterium OLB23]|nr:MAG: Folylpolyglutamate synthase [Microgenomates bacterium OLB23]